MIPSREGAAPPRRLREIVAWCLYDFANSSYTTLIVTVAFSVYFRDAVVNASDNSGDRLWGMANFLAMLTVALAAPILGAVSDYSRRKKFFLIVTTLQTVSATALMFFVGPGDVFLGMLLFILGTIGFEGGYVFYNSFLPDVSTPETIGRISGWAWAVGYAGGLLSLVLAWPLISKPLKDGSGLLDPGAVTGRQTSFLLVAVFFGVFALPAFIWLREPSPQGRLDGLRDYLRIGFRRVGETLSHLREFREAGKFVLASLFFTDGITTVISFSAIYATTTFHFSSGDLVFLFLALNIIAFPGALAAGYLADSIGAKRTIVLSLLVWIVVVIVGCTAQNRAMFWLMATLAAIGMGSTQAVGRSFMAQVTPPSRESEFFGFYVLSGKFASMFGPLLFGLVSQASGSQRLAVLSLLPFFLVGLGLMLWIDPAQAIRDASLAERS